MAGLHFGTSSWDNIPATLGMTVNGGHLLGKWQGIDVEAYFTNRYDQQTQSYYHYTCLKAHLDPPLGLRGLEGGEAMKRVVEPAFRADIEARAKALELHEVSFGDGSIYAEYNNYQSDPSRFRAGFDLLTWAAKIVLDRREKNPPAWQHAIAAEWPRLAQGWGFQLDARRGVMKGTVRGRPTSASVIVKEGRVTTQINVAVSLPPNCTMSLTRQKDGFFSKMFRGQDIRVGDPAFDAAFVIKGEPEDFVRAALTPAARQQIMTLSHAGASITLEDGELAAWTDQLVTNLEHLDALMKTAYLAAEALLPPQPGGAQPPQGPFR